MSTEVDGLSESIENIQMEQLPSWDDTGESIITMNELLEEES